LKTGIHRQEVVPVRLIVLENNGNELTENYVARNLYLI
jgi:hypothetical protein